MHTIIDIDQQIRFRECSTCRPDQMLWLWIYEAICLRELLVIIDKNSGGYLDTYLVTYNTGWTNAQYVLILAVFQNMLLRITRPVFCVDYIMYCDKFTCSLRPFAHIREASLGLSLEIYCLYRPSFLVSK